jgi:hypothetical protein
MRHLCKQCLEDEGIGMVLTIAVLGTVKCDGCGSQLKNDEINSVSEDGLIGGYFHRIAKAKERAREAAKQMVLNKVAPLEVYIYQDKNIKIMVPVNEELCPVQIIGEEKGSGGF